MNFKTTYTLFALLGALLVVLAVVLYWGAVPESAQGLLLRSLHDKANPVEVADVTRVQIEQKNPADATLVFTRDPNTKQWQISEPRPMAADSLNIDGLIQQLRGASLEEDSRPENAKKAGLDEPKRIITLEGKDKVVTVTIGDVTPGTEDALVYLTSSDLGGQPQAVKKIRIEKALEPLPYFRNKDLLGKETTDIRSIKLTEGKKQLELEKVGERWRMIQPPYGDAELDNLPQNLTNLSVHYGGKDDSDFVADAVTDLGEYNLDPAKQSVLRIEVGRGQEGKTLTKQTVVVGISKKVQDAGKKAEDRYYAYVDNDAKTKDIVRVEVKHVEPILKVLESPENLRNKTLVQMTSNPDAIEIENTYGKLEFLRPDVTKPWQLYRGSATANTVEESEVQLLISTLTKKDQVQSFPDPKRQAELGLAKDRKADVVVKVYAGSLEKVDEKKPGKPAFKKDAKPAVTLRFGNRERGSVAVERIVGDEATLVMVPESVRDLVGKSPLAYLDKSLPQFNPNATDAAENVTKVVVERAGTVYEVSRASASDPWKLVKPDNLKDRNANATVIEDILSNLNRLKAVEIAAEKADASELAKSYDLEKPPYKVTITVSKDGKSTDHVYNLGKEISGKGYYAKLGGRDTIYVVGSETVTPLKKDLQDPTVFNFAPASVTNVKLTGWRKATGRVTSLVFERKEGKWTAKEPADYALDPAKLEEFLSSLANLRAEKFTSAGKELSLDQDAFEVELRIEGKPEPVQILVGGKEGTSYSASSKQLKGDFFTVPAHLFDGPRGSPGYFSK